MLLSSFKSEVAAPRKTFTLICPPLEIENTRKNLLKKMMNILVALESFTNFVINTFIMSDVIYAIIRDDETSKLRKVTESISSTRTVSESELCEFHDYAIELYDAYSSCLPKVNVSNNGIIPQKNFRERAVLFEDAIVRLKEKYHEKLIAHSHRYGGWKSFEWQFNDDIHFVINTNFGYGSNSYFEQSIFYKGLKLAPYSKLVKYRYANFVSITSHTYEYEFIYSEWLKLMDDSLEFYNAIVEKKDNHIFNWLKRHLDKMVDVLERYIQASYCYFDNIIPEYNWGRKSYRISSERVDGDEFWIAKSNKLSEALLFIDNITELPIQVDPQKYINRIRRINETFLPLLECKIESLKNYEVQLQEQIDTISTEFPLALYLKLYDKYYHKKKWFLSRNKILMIRFLMTILRRKSDMPNSEIRDQLKTLKKQKKAWDELRDKLSKTNYIITILSEDKDNIVKFFKSKKGIHK